jgi:hypothetical protein
MRLLLSQFQTPTTPRRVVGFFGSGCSTGCPAEPITQSTSDWPILFEPTLSIVDGAKVKPSEDHYQCRFSVQTMNTVALLANTRNRLIVRALLDV